VPDIGLEYENVGFILETRAPLRVPPYQRAYSWTDDQVDDLIRDLKPLVAEWESSDDVKDHFYGSLVTVGKKNPGKATLMSFEVIDGQQRLATFTLLLAAVARGFASLHAAAKAAGAEDVAAAAQSYYEDIRDKNLIKVEPKKKEKLTSPRVELSRRDDDFFASLTRLTDEVDQLPSLPKAPPAKPASHARMYAAYQRLSDQLVKPIVNDLELVPDAKLDKLIAIKEALTQSGSVVNIITGTDAEAYSLFSVLNDRGLALAEGDLLRARTLAMLEKYPSIQGKAEAIWDKLLEGEASYTDAFLRDYYASVTGERSPSKDLSRRFLDPREDGVQLLAFPSPIEDQKQAQALLKELGSMQQEMTTHWTIRQGLWPYEGGTATDWEKSRLDRLVSILARTSVIPLLMAVFVARDEPEFRDTVMLLERMDFRYLVVGAHAGSLAEFYWKQAREIRDDKKFGFAELKAQIEPFIWGRADDDRFKAALPGKVSYGVSGPQTKRLLHLLTTLNDCLGWLEDKSGKPFYVDASAVWDLKVIDIEHVFPQKAGKTCPDAALEPDKHQLGNLTPWGYKPNRTAGATKECFDKKKVRYELSDMALTREVGKNASWDRTAFDERHKLMTERALKYFAVSPAGMKKGNEAKDPNLRPATTWLLNQKPNSKWDDIEGLAYHYKKSTTHGRLGEGKYTIAPGDFVICYRGLKQKDPGIFGVGRVDDIDEESKELVASYDWYEEIDPPLTLIDVPGLPTNYNLQNAIHEVEPKFAEAVLALGKVSRPQAKALA
jgi:Protein of unknown function DUF262/Protein of unknown function (DUF1524)